MFFRPKDQLDVRYVVPLLANLDRDFVRQSLVEAVGEKDARVRAWDDLIGA